MFHHSTKTLIEVTNDLYIAKFNSQLLSYLTNQKHSLINFLHLVSRTLHSFLFLPIWPFPFSFSSPFSSTFWCCCPPGLTFWNYIFKNIYCSDSWFLFSLISHIKSAQIYLEYNSFHYLHCYHPHSTAVISKILPTRLSASIPVSVQSVVDIVVRVIPLNVNYVAPLLKNLWRHPASLRAKATFTVV